MVTVADRADDGTTSDPDEGGPTSTDPDPAVQP
jgi:hypothetical protein